MSDNKIVAILISECKYRNGLSRYVIFTHSMLCVHGSFKNTLPKT